MHNTYIPCGCEINYEGDQFHPDYSIQWCQLHANAEKLRGVVDTILEGYRRSGEVRHIYMAALDAVCREIAFS